MICSIRDLFVIIGLPFLCLNGVINAKVAYHCYNDPGTGHTTAPDFQAFCPDGLRIQVNEGLYAASGWGLCYYARGDDVCAQRTKTSIPCCGARSCKISRRKVFLPKCGYATFFRLSYDCVPESEITCQGKARKPKQIYTRIPPSKHMTSYRELTSPPGMPIARQMDGLVPANKTYRSSKDRDRGFFNNQATNNRGTVRPLKEKGAGFKIHEVADKHPPTVSSLDANADETVLKMDKALHLNFSKYEGTSQAASSGPNVSKPKGRSTMYAVVGVGSVIALLLMALFVYLWQRKRCRSGEFTTTPIVTITRRDTSLSWSARWDKTTNEDASSKVLNEDLHVDDNAFIGPRNTNLNNSPQSLRSCDGESLPDSGIGAQDLAMISREQRENVQNSWRGRLGHVVLPGAQRNNLNNVKPTNNKRPKPNVPPRNISIQKPKLAENT